MSKTPIGLAFIRQPANVGSCIITIASRGDAREFGEIYGNTGARQNAAACASPTRMLIAGGGYPTVLSGIDYFTIPTLGNSSDFGDLQVAARGIGGLSNSTRGVFSGGGPPSAINIMEYVEIATLGDATAFGDLFVGGGTLAGASSATRGVWSNGSNSHNTMSYLTINTTGAAVDFGDSTDSYGDERGSSNAHGGLG